MPLLRTPKRPHPRSLDALFPPPPPRPRCEVGHLQRRGWQPGDLCQHCLKADEDYYDGRPTGDAAARNREEFSRRNPSGPEHTIRVVSTGQLIRYTIPRGQRPKAVKRALRARRRRGA